MRHGRLLLLLAALPLITVPGCDRADAPRPQADVKPADVGLRPRSPLLQRGESMTAPLPPTRLGPPPSPAAQGPRGVIGPDDAAAHVGSVVTVEGTIVATGRTQSAREGTIYFLNYHEQWRDRFYVVVFEKAAAAWPEPADTYFRHKTIRVTGKVELYRQTRPQIQVRVAGQIEMVD